MWRKKKNGEVLFGIEKHLMRYKKRIDETKFRENVLKLSFPSCSRNRLFVQIFSTNLASKTYTKSTTGARGLSN